jgi:ABC-2 type transport system permease protein
MLLRGKVVVSAVVTAVVALVACLASFFVSQWVLGDIGASLDDGGAVRAILGSAFFLVAIGVIATAVGFITRSTAGGIAAMVALLLILPVFGGLVPVDVVEDLMDYLPSSAGIALYGVGTDAPISPLAGFLALCAWMGVAVAVGGVALQRRDA